ncbi:dUTP diphosphatase [Halorhodospira neutriphila]|uniref:Deoxyuridine 5'-triphosphate nucleotidohydrolase n=1 Tax=Halorhodospira neutriphila TaxID=168379 RepID=A0ABS1E5U7_9GAMM|nr:dUTP diphosphatase [Halorhodospira neutriphila]MBK1727050.1 deoxyuridine 5'-triphosphate nucleotidohydrolase [Halorhodospira neutriphila]
MPRRIETRILDGRLGSEWPLPGYATDGSAALDLRACLDAPQTLHPGERRLVGTGLAVHIADPNLVGIVASRSGLSLKHGLRVAQGIGVIDADYTGEIGVILHHDGTVPYELQPGERIAQLMLQPVERVALEPVEAFSAASGRGAGGFGHSGKA